MYRTFRDRAEIYIVYIAEAHAENEWKMVLNEEEGICIRQHTTFAERMAAARLCAEQLALTIPTLVDAMDNAAAEQFAAWPERIYIAGADGRIAYKGGPGPSEFDPDEATAALRGLLNA